MSLQYLKKKVRDEADFLHAKKHQSFLQVDFKNLGIKTFNKVIRLLLITKIKHSQRSESNKFSHNISKKKLAKNFIFLHTD